MNEITVKSAVKRICFNAMSDTQYTVDKDDYSILCHKKEGGDPVPCTLQALGESIEEDLITFFEIFKFITFKGEMWHKAPRKDFQTEEEREIEKTDGLYIIELSKMEAFYVMWE